MHTRNLKSLLGSIIFPFSVIFILALPLRLAAQNLTYVYDFANKSITVIDGEDTVKNTRPSIGIGRLVVIKIININRRHYSIVINGENKDIIESSQSTKDLLSKVKPQANTTPDSGAGTKTNQAAFYSLTKLNHGSLNITSSAIDEVNASEAPSKTKLRITPQIRALLDQILSDCKSGEFSSKSNSSISEIQSYLSTLNVIKSTTASIINESVETLESAKSQTNKCTTPLLKSVPLGDQANVLSQLINDMQDKDKLIISNFLIAQQKYIDYKECSDRLREFTDNFLLDQAIVAEIELHNGKEFNELLVALYDSLIKNYNSYISLRTDLFNAIASQYEIIFNTEYDFDYSIPATGDLVNIDLKIFNKPADNSDPVAAKQTPIDARIISVGVSGGWKVSVSSGFGITNFLGRQKNYYNRGFNKGKADSTIVGKYIDDYYPDLSFFINAYPRTVSGFGPGVTLGIGIPLLSTNKTPSVMLGGSIIMGLGTTERLIFTFGLCGGSINVLKNGFSQGDVLQGPTAEVPIDKGYAFGLFLGLSYNLKEFSLPW